MEFHARRGLLLRVKPRRHDEARSRRHRIEQAKTAILDDKTRAEKVLKLWFLYIDTGRTEEVVNVRRDQAGRKVFVRARRPIIQKKQANTQEVRRIRAALEAASRRNPQPE